MTPENDMPDSYLSEDLPVPEWKKELYGIVYGKDMETQPLCPCCGRPMYYSLDKRTGGIRASCEVCGTKDPQQKRDPECENEEVIR